MSTLNQTQQLKFGLLICCAPSRQLIGLRAFQFADSLVKLGHRLHRVFFYQDAVLLASQHYHPPNHELNLQQAWLQLAARQKLSLEVCPTAGRRRAVVGADEAQLLGLSCNLAEGFSLSGVSQLVLMSHECDRMVQFR